MQQVHCQRFFAQGPHSSYFEVRQPETAAAEEEHPDGSIEGTWNRAWVRANKVFDEIQAKTTIVEGEKDEVNPWVRRAGWAQYLGGFDREQLLHCIREPDAEAEQEGDREPVEAAMWKAVEDVTRKSQCSVDESGIMLRMHAVRTEKDQVRYEPLQPYWDEKSIGRHCRPWQ